MVNLFFILDENYKRNWVQNIPGFVFQTKL